MKKLIVLFVMFGVSFPTFAQRRSSPRTMLNTESKFTYDLSGSVGSYNGNSYTEITLGLNYLMADWLTWRNAAFSRTGANIESVVGLDSSARLETSATSESGGTGFNAFIGPGVRLASQDNTAVFAEAGVTFRLGGLKIGGGVKSLQYVKNRELDGIDLPKSDTQYFLIFGGGGTF